MGLVATAALVTGLVIGVPLLLVAVSAAGPVGWLAAALIGPLVVLAGLLVAARHRGEAHDGP